MTSRDQALPAFPSGEYFAHPLTSAKFDRTPAQRETHARHIFQISQIKVAAPSDPNAVANRRMFNEFVDDIDALIEAGVATQASDAVTKLASRPGNTLAVDAAPMRTLARQAIVAEIQQLDEALPHPVLDRMAAVEGQMHLPGIVDQGDSL